MEGTLTIMFGGEEMVFEQVCPVLHAIGSEVIYMGDVGNGQLTKLVNQLLFNISAAAIAEVLPMAAKLGLDAEKVTQVITTWWSRGPAASCDKGCAAPASSGMHAFVPISQGGSPPDEKPLTTGSSQSVAGGVSPVQSTAPSVPLFNDGPRHRVPPVSRTVQYPIRRFTSGPVGHPEIAQ